VNVATGDAGLGVPENAPYDRAIVTIGSLDIITIYPAGSAPQTTGAQVITREHCTMTVVY
jgi:hypothetical protein